MAEASLPAMTGAELQVTREFLGLTTAWIAEKFSVNERRLQRMEVDGERIPEYLIKFMDETVMLTEQLLTDLTATYRRKVRAAGDEPVLFKVYRKESAYQDAPEDGPGVRHDLSVKWHRMLAARLCSAVPGLIPSYWEIDEIPVVEDFRAKFSNEMD